MRRTTWLACLSVMFFGCGGGSSGNNSTPAAITVVQSVGASAGCTQTSGCNSQSLLLPNPVQNGNLIAVMLWWNESNVNGSAVVTVTDSLKNNYVNIGPTTNFSCGSSKLCYGFYARNAADGADNVQVSLANSNGGGFSAVAIEIKGPTTLGALGAPNSCGANMPCTWTGGGCGSASGCTTYSTLPFQVAHADEILIGMASLQADCNTAGCASGFQIQPGPGFTQAGYEPPYFAVEYMITTTQGQYTGVFNSNAPGVGQTIFVAFY